MESDDQGNVDGREGATTAGYICSTLKSDAMHTTTRLSASDCLWVCYKHWKIIPWLYAKAQNIPLYASVVAQYNTGMQKWNPQIATNFDESAITSGLPA
ncbi:MAG: hypothetical protein EOM24_16330 [Chloroflexia bacterium]|nr:hypothetical protein [Chloroflexia bacterium]